MSRRTNRPLSKQLTAEAWAVVRGEPLLLKLLVTGSVLAFVVAVAVAGPGAALVGADVVPALGWVLLVVGAYLGTFMVVRYQAAMVVVADDSLAGRTPERGRAMHVSGERVGALAGWAGIQLAVGWLLAAVRGDGGGDNAGVAILRAVLAGTLAAIWSLITLFVVPVIVFERLGAVGAIKRSAHIFKDRWGTQLFGEVRIALKIALFLILPGILLVVLGVFALASLEAPTAGILGVSAIVVGAVALVVGSLLQTAVRTVFAVALYRYATTGQTPAAFGDTDLAGAVSAKGASEDVS